MEIGSAAHLELFCQSFIDSHHPYQPEHWVWPPLNQDQLQLLQTIPFWQQALQTEHQAGLLLDQFAQTIADPQIQTAIALQAMEESRHAQILNLLTQHYQIQVPASTVSATPDNLTSAFIQFGFQECLDSFFAFGLFGLARQANVLPDALFTLFDPILDEEARHIVFFINWFAYYQAHSNSILGLPFAAHSSWRYSRAVMQLIQTLNLGANGQSGNLQSSSLQGKGFTATGAKMFIQNLTLQHFLATCLAENSRRMSIFDSRLLQPEFLPQMAKMILTVLPKRASAKAALQT
jgi:hypothetical protein